MTEPPVAAGGVHRAVALIAPPATPAVAVPMTGAPGTVAGVTAIDRAEKALVPTAFTAATWKRYAVPLVRPVTTRLVAAAPAGRRAPTWVPAALTTRTENPVMGEPPLAPAVHRTVAEALPGVAVPIVGAAGAVGATGVAVPDAAGPVPNWFTADSRKVYCVPLVRPVTTREVAVREMPVMVWTGAAAVLVPVKTCSVKLLAVAGPVKFTVAEALPGTTLVIVGAAGGATVSVVSLNFSCSMFHRVSTPSSFGAAPTAGAVALASATVIEPFAFAVIVYCESGPL